MKSVAFAPGAETGEKETDNHTAEEGQDNEKGERDVGFLPHQVDGDGFPVEGHNDKNYRGNRKEGADTQLGQKRGFAPGRWVCDGR